MQEFTLMTDDEILKEIASRFEKKRLQKQISDHDIIKKGGCTKDALWRFRSGEAITTKNLIKILRGLGELGALDQLFQIEDTYRPSLKKTPDTPKRVYPKKKKQQKPFIWGEDK
jgi:hypothetical protein